ncbi:MAG: VWA domain-containing protein [Spirochaetaceae bacterium]|nr:VWA domain-containing protein [Spirochaetaceae bacterium]
MSLTYKIEIPRRIMVLFFIIDTSGSMDGSKIGAVNVAIEEVIPAIREVSDENADAQIKIAALEFSSGARWVTVSGPVEADKFRWNYLDASGVTDFGAACKTLNEKLSTKAFMQEATGSFAPAIFLLSDGEPTDDWQGALATLKKNNWFKAAIKVAIAIGDDANKDVLKEFTGTMEAVMEIHNAAVLKKMIKFVSVTASKIASKSSNVDSSTLGASAGDMQKQQELNTCLQEFAEDIATTRDNDQSDW